MAVVDPSWPRANVWLAQEAEDPDLRVVGVPSSSSSLTPSRADLTPLAVRDRFGRFSTFHGEWNVDFGGLTVYDEGNWPVSSLSMDDMPERVEALARLLPETPLTLFLGGDNAITRPLLRARAASIEKAGLMTFDAHHDVRVLDFGPTNGTPVRGLIEEDGLPGGNISQIGLHSFANSAEYRSYCDQAGIVVKTVAEIRADGIADTVGSQLARLASQCETIYVDVDMDVLDSAFAPGCPGARPGGLTVRELAEAVRTSARHPMVSAIDFVEVDAELDPTGVTLDAMAHVVLSACAGFAERG
jgi:formimidoylglutamase